MSTKTPLLDLGNEFYLPVSGGPFRNPMIRYRNQKQSEFLDLGKLSDHEWIAHFGNFVPFENNLNQALAMKYHGHQFQHYNPDIGDGRGFVFAQFIKSASLFELGTKGSGKTPFSRRGDGRLTLKGAVRELLATDYLEKQRVLTSKTFSIVETAEELERHDEPSPTRSAVLFRLSRGHIRIGNFQYAHYHQSKENIEKLIDYSLQYFYPELKIPLSGKEKTELFFRNASLRLADLCASYMVAGFVHGVLNTDNMNVSGESFDYGPYRFLPYYDPYFTAAYFDHEGLYSFGRQPPSFLWNLAQLRGALKFAEPAADLSWLEDDFAIYFNVFFTARFLKKLNLKPTSQLGNQDLASALLSLSPDYYDDFEFPIHDVTKISMETLKEIGSSVFFSHSQSLIEYFFQDLYQNQSKVFETSFLELLNWTQTNASTNYFSNETLKIVATYFEPIKKLSTNQIELRNQTLLIDEIESIWKEIAENDNWSPLYSRTNK